MKKNFRFLAMAVVAMAAAVFTGCSSDDDFLAPYEESAINGDWNQILSSREFQH